MRPNFHTVEVEEMLQHAPVVNFLVQARIEAALALMLQNKFTEARVLLVGAVGLCSGDGKANDTDVDNLHQSVAIVYFAVELARQRGDNARADYLLSQAESAT